jgi:hypothetical protein
MSSKFWERAQRLIAVWNQNPKIDLNVSAR